MNPRNKNKTVSRGCQVQARYQKMCGIWLLDAEVGVVAFDRLQVGRYRNHKSAGTVTRPVTLILFFVLCHFGFKRHAWRGKHLILTISGGRNVSFVSRRQLKACRRATEGKKKKTDHQRSLDRYDRVLAIALLTLIGPNAILDVNDIHRLRPRWLCFLSDDRDVRWCHPLSAYSAHMGRQLPYPTILFMTWDISWSVCLAALTISAN